TQRLGELAATHVESVDMARAALQQDIGEAPCRRTDVEGDLVGGIDPERIERGSELVATPPDVGVRLIDRDPCVRWDAVARFDVPSPSIPFADADLAGHHEGLRLG